MKQFAFVTSEGIVSRTASPGQDDMYTDGEYYDGLLCVEIPVDADALSYHRSKWYKDGTWLTRSEKPNDFHYWRGASESWVLDSEKIRSILRFERDQKLYASDWTQIPDAPLTPEQKTAWQTYRQALRDVPANNADITDLDQVVWPTQPE